MKNYFLRGLEISKIQRNPSPESRKPMFEMFATKFVYSFLVNHLKKIKPSCSTPVQSPPKEENDDKTRKFFEFLLINIKKKSSSKHGTKYQALLHYLNITDLVLNKKTSHKMKRPHRRGAFSLAANLKNKLMAVLAVGRSRQPPQKTTALPKARLPGSH